MVAEPETDVKLRVYSLQRLRRSTNFMRSCAEPETVHKPHASPVKKARKA